MRAGYQTYRHGTTLVGKGTKYADKARKKAMEEMSAINRKGMDSSTNETTMAVGNNDYKVNKLPPSNTLKCLNIKHKLLHFRQV